MSSVPQFINARQFDLSTILLIDSAGRKVDIKFMVKDLNIYQDMYANVMSGELVVDDSMNIIGQTMLHGNEFVFIKFTSATEIPFEKFFRVYKVSDMVLTNPSTVRYTLHLCSEEFLLNQQTRVSKSYKNMLCSDIVRDICNRYLEIPLTKFPLENSEPTTGVRSVIVPNMKPFEAINFISAMSLNADMSGAYLFFETIHGYIFKSLNNIVAGPTYKTIQVKPQNILSENSLASENQHTAYKYELKQGFDVLESLANGGFRGSMLKLNLIDQTKDYISVFPTNSKFNGLNTYMPINDATNRLGLTLTDASAFVRMYVDVNANMSENWLLQRAMQMSLLNAHRVNIEVAGDTQLTVGVIVELQFPQRRPVNDSSQIELDPDKSGRYLITGARHRITNNKYTCYLELCKDSSIAPVIPQNDNSTLYELATKS